MTWHLRGEPRPVQLEALSKSRRRHGWAHFMEMRLGKSAVALNEFVDAWYRRTAPQHLVIFCPNKFKGGWLAEIEKWCPDFSAFAMIYDAKIKDDEWYAFEQQSSGILIVNYELLTRQKHFERFEWWCSVHAPMLVCDESAMVKNPASRKFKMLYKLRDKCHTVRILSGKPAPYAPYDLWSQLRLIGMTEYRSFYGFKNTFVKLGGWQGKQVVGTKNEKRLDELLTKYSFRAKQVDWGIDKGVDYEVVEVSMTRDQKRAYDEMEKEFITWLASGEAITVDTVLAKHQKMLQISSGFAYDANGEAEPIMPPEFNPKLADMLDRIRNYIEGKVIIIGHFRQSMLTLHHFFQQFDDLGPIAVIGSRQTTESVEHNKTLFNVVPECRIMIAQAESVKYGHRLMGTDNDPCHTMMFFENSYNLDTRAQCEARPQGFGQLAPIHIMDYCASPAEKKVIAALQKREKVSEAIMSGYR